MAVSKPTKKATATTELVLGQAAQQITKAVTELNLATASIGKLSAQAEELTLQVANKEDAIAALEIAFKEKERQLNVDLDLSFKSNTDGVVTEFLKSNGKVSISSEELQSLRQDLSETKANAEAEAKKQVAQATASIKSEYENAIKLLHSENKAVAAENAAKIGTLETQNTFLKEQVVTLYGQLDSERSAGIERAKAGSVGTINLGDGNRK
jgi:chromosome segregation ATPase